MRESSVVVTGLGAVTAAGQDVETLWRNARDGVSGVGTFILPNMPNQRVKIAAAIPDADYTGSLPRSLLAVSDRVARFGLVAAAQAMADAGLDQTPLGPRAAVVMGCGIGGSTTYDTGHAAFYGGKSRLHPLTIPMVMPSAAGSLISAQYGAKGFCTTISTACSSSAQAVGLGLALLRSGQADVVIAGGTEALLTAPTVRAWEMLRVLTPDACRPFSLGRNGMVLGEGAAVVVLERAASATARGAAIHCELAGFGTTADALDLLRPDPDGAARAMQAAIADAGLAPDDIDYVNAHGTATIMNDAAESEALRRVFGAGINRVSVSSTKPVHGHTLGAAGAIELVVSIKALQEQTVPPTLNFLERDPACAIDCVPLVARRRPIRAALSNSFAFGGINASLVIRPAS